MKNLTISILFLTLAFVACKKKDSSPDDGSKTVAPNTTAGITTGNNILTPCNSGGPVYNGILQLEEYNQWYMGVKTNWQGLYNTKFMLYQNAVTSYGCPTSERLGVMSVNNNILQYYTPLKMYFDTVNGKNYSQQRLVTLNSTVLPSFTVAVQDSFPVFTPANAVQIHDTLFINNNFTVPLNGITYYDRVDCLLSFANPSTQAQVYIRSHKFSNTLVNSLVFTPTDLSVFTAGQDINCRLVLTKIHTEIIGGKNFKFEVQSYNDFYLKAQ